MNFKMGNRSEQRGVFRKEWSGMTGKTEILAKKLPLKTEGGKVDAFLITSPVNRRYLTGFPSSAGMVLVTKEEAYFLTDFRYAEAAHQKIKNCQVLEYERAFVTLKILLEKHRIRRIAIEQKEMSLAEYSRYQSYFSDYAFENGPELDGQLGEMRAVKSQEELHQLRQAQEITDAAYHHILQRIAPGRTEREIALDLEFFMRSSGAEAVAFDLIVVSGAKSSMPHGVPDEKKVEKGDFVTMDTGAVVGGMHADMTRTVAVGEASVKQREIYDIVLRAQLAAIAAVKDGVLCSEVDRAARDVIVHAGYGSYFGHSTGHSVGFEIHEDPVFSPASHDVAKTGMVITVEPGIYLPGQFGVRIEDMVLVTPDGCEDLTHSPKDLMIL